MRNALTALRQLVAPTAKRRAATVAKLLPGGRVELAVAAAPAATEPGTLVARPVVYCGVAVAVGDRVLVEGDRVVSRLAREAERTVRIK